MRLILCRQFKPCAQKIKIPVNRSTWCRMYEMKEREREKVNRKRTQL